MNPVIAMLIGVVVMMVLVICTIMARKRLCIPRSKL